MDTSKISEGDARVLLGRYLHAQLAENRYQGDPSSHEALRLEAETEKHKARIIESMIGSPWKTEWKHG